MTAPDPRGQLRHRPPPRGDDGMTEILARFARSGSRDAPVGTVQLAGHPPVAFAGWLDLMARVEEMLAADPEGGVR